MEHVFTARIKYSKTGLIRFIGHLDTLRMLSRAVRASGLPINYSQGFNPHPKLSFGPPLPLGFSSECEFFDIELLEKEDSGAVEAALKPRLPKGITVDKIAMLSYRPSALTKIIDHVRYCISLPAEYYSSQKKIQEILHNSRPETDDAANISRILEHIESMECVKKDDQRCEYQLVQKGVHRGAPSVTKTFLSLLNIDIFGVDTARMHRVEQWSERGGRIY